MAVDWIGYCHRIEGFATGGTISEFDLIATMSPIRMTKIKFLHSPQLRY